MIKTSQKFGMNVWHYNVCNIGLPELLSLIGEES